jgi:hypothetical protein
VLGEARCPDLRLFQLSYGEDCQARSSSFRPIAVCVSLEENPPALADPQMSEPPADSLTAAL